MRKFNKIGGAFYFFMLAQLSRDLLEAKMKEERYLFFFEYRCWVLINFLAGLQNL